MELIIPKQTLQDEIGALSGVVEKKGTIPILEYALLKLEATKINMTATDLDLSMFSSCSAHTAEGQGSLCVPARRLFDIVKLLPDGMVKLAEDPVNHWLKIECGRSKYKLACGNPDQFPQVPSIPNDWLYVPSKILRSALKGVAFAASAQEDNRYAVQGVKIEVTETDLKMVATDGHRIGVTTGPLDDLMMETMDALLPGKGVGELIRLLSSYDGPVGIAQKENGLFFQAGPRVLHSRLLAGKFPQFGPAFKQTYSFAVSFRADVLAKSLRRTSQVSDNTFSAVTLTFKDGRVTLYSQDPEAGECEEVMEGSFEGPELSIALSAKFLLEYIDQMGEEPVRFDIKDANTPILLQTLKDGLTYKYLLIPLRVKGQQ